MPTDPTPVVLLLGDQDWTDLTALLSMHANVVTDAAHADHAARMAVVAVGEQAHEAYELAATDHAAALVLIAAEPPAAAVVDRLSSLELPVFLIWGEDDDVVPVSVGEELTEVFPMATLAVVPESGNDVLATDAVTVLPLIKEYLKVRFLGVTHGHEQEPVVFELASFTRPEHDHPAYGGGETDD